MNKQFLAESLLHSGNYLWYGTGHWQMYNISINGIGILSEKILKNNYIKIYRKYSVLTPDLRLAIEAAIKSCEVKTNERLYLVLCQASPQLMAQVRDSRIPAIPNIKFTEIDGNRILAIYISKYPSTEKLEQSYIFTETWGDPIWDSILLAAAKKASLDIQINIPPKPVVEHVEAKNTTQELLKIFIEVQRNLKSAKFGDQIDETIQELHNKGDNLYSYKIPLKETTGYILLQYEDYVADMTTFEEFMHSQRGKCEIYLIRTIAYDNNCRLEDAVKNFFPKSDIHISIKDNDNGKIEIQAKVSFYIYLLDYSKKYLGCLCNCIIDLWNESNRFIASADE